MALRRPSNTRFQRLKNQTIMRHAVGTGWTKDVTDILKSDVILWAEGRLGEERVEVGDKQETICWEQAEGSYGMATCPILAALCCVARKHAFSKRTRHEGCGGRRPIWKKHARTSESFSSSCSFRMRSPSRFMLGRIRRFQKVLKRYNVKTGSGSSLRYVKRSAQISPVGSARRLMPSPNAGYRTRCSVRGAISD